MVSAKLYRHTQMGPGQWPQQIFVRVICY